MHELEIDARQLNSIMWNLDRDPNWPKQEENLKQIIFAMSFFEKLGIFLQEKILTDRDINLLFGYRIRQFLGNELIWEHIESNRARMDFSLLDKLKATTGIN